MNIGLGLQAADAFFKADDARKTREYTQALRDAELSGLPDRTNAERSGYRLRAGQNQAGLDMLPQETENKRSRLTLESGDLAGQKERQPVEQQTKTVQANMGLSNAQNDQANLPKTQAVKNNAVQSQFLQSNADLDLLPDKLEAAAVQGVLSKQGQTDMVVGTLGQLIARQDKEGALRFANNVAKRTKLIPTSNGKNFTDIRPVRGGPNGDGYIFVTEDGQENFVPVQAIKGAMDKLKSGEYQFIHDNYGNVYAGNKATGSVTQTHQGDPNLRRAQHNPADVQSAEWLMKNVPRYANNPELAWDAVRSSKEKTRTSFIMDYVAKNALPGQDTNQLADTAGKVYDALRQNQGPTAAPSNSATGGTLGSGTYDPRINSLIGVPSQ